MSENHEESGTSPRAYKRWGPIRRWLRYRDFSSEDSEFWNSRDPIENANGRLPDDESLHMPAIWVAELYTPSTINNLFNGIRKLGWEYGRTQNQDVVKWMNEVRQGRKAGWTKLGLVSPIGNRQMMSDRVAELPAGTQAAFPSLISLTPSITAMIVCFVLDDDVATTLEEPMRSDFDTRISRHPHTNLWQLIRYIITGHPVQLGHSIATPDLIRRATIKTRLQEIEKPFIGWVRENFFGAFGSLSDACNPTSVLLITDKTRPLTEEARQIRAFDGLGLDREFEAWDSREWPGVKLRLPGLSEDGGTRITLACSRNDGIPDKRFYHKPESNWTIAQHGDGMIRGFLARWSISCLLDSYHQSLSTWRDQIALDSGYRTVRDLKMFRSLVRTMLYDVELCAQEVIEFSANKHAYHFDTMEMSRSLGSDEDSVELLGNLRSSQRSRAKQVRREAELFRATLSASNQVSQTISSIRIQRVVMGLTIVSIGVACLIGYATVGTS